MTLKTCLFSSNRLEVSWMASYVRQVALNPAASSLNVIMLLEYFSPLIFAFKLVNNDGYLVLSKNVTTLTYIVISLLELELLIQ